MKPIVPKKMRHLNLQSTLREPDMGFGSHVETTDRDGENEEEYCNH